LSLIITVVALGLGMGCTDKPASETFNRVEVTRLGPPEVGGGRTVVLQEPSAIDEAGAFFPGFTRGRTSWMAFFCLPTVRFVFIRPFGETVEVTANDEIWHSTVTKGGDFEVNGDLKTYVDKLFAEDNVTE